MRVADDQNHSWTKNGNVAVIALQRGHGGVVGTGDGEERLSSLYFVMQNRVRGRWLRTGLSLAAMVGVARC